MNIVIKHVKNNETITLTLTGKDSGERHESIANALKPYNMYFGCETWLYDCITDEHIAILISDSDELTDYLNICNAGY